MQPALAPSQAQAREEDSPDAEAAPLALARLLVRASACRRRGDPAGAAALYAQALALDPDQPQALLSQANACLDLCQAQAALDAVDRALALLPADGHLHYTRGLALHQAQRLDEALAAFERARALGADARQVRFAQACTQLMRGDLAAGWAGYEARAARERALAPWLDRGLEPLPSGGDTQGRGLLLVAEQGLGDMLMFARFACALAARGERVWLACPPSLCGLLSRLPGLAGVLDVVPADARQLPPDLAWVMALGSLPLHLGLGAGLEAGPGPGPRPGLASSAPLPQAAGYLQPDPARVAAWRTRLGPATRPRVGLAWAGGEGHVADLGRSLTLAQLLPALPAGIDYLHLQPDLRAADRLTLAALAQDLQDPKLPQIRHFGAEIRDFDDSAALCALVDEVLTIDTSVAHLAGALGRPATVLLAWTPCWRWGLAGERSDWYASLRLLRQPGPGQWAPVLQSVAERLGARAGHSTEAIATTISPTALQSCQCSTSPRA